MTEPTCPRTAVRDSAQAPSLADARPAAGPRTRTRLIATDLDGTLLRDDKTVSARTVAALAAAEAAGIAVFFVTGRPVRWMDVVREHVHGHGLAICANGAVTVDLRNGGRMIDIRPLTPANALAIVRALRAAAPGTSFAVERSGGIHYEPEYPPLFLDPAASVAPAEVLLAEQPQRAERTERTEPGAAAEDGPQPVLKLLAFHPELDPDAFLSLGRSAAGAYGQFTRSSPSALLEISGAGVGKASTLARCCAQRGIRPEEVVAFGDMPNDLEMLTWAGTSYAMANAHPEVLTATTHRARANHEDGVARVIESLLEQQL